MFIEQMQQIEECIAKRNNRLTHHEIKWSGIQL